MASITISVQSLLNSAQYDSYTLDNTSLVNELKDNIQTATSVDVTWFDLVFNEDILGNDSLASYGITDGSVLRSANVIARLPTLQDRQLAKLNLSHLERQELGNTRPNYDITELPTQYVGNIIVDNPNPDGLILGRPWITSAPAPYSLSFDGSTNFTAVRGTLSDWNLGNTYTIEWWSKADHDTSDRINTVMCQQPGQGIDIFYDSAQLAINDGLGDYIRTLSPPSEPPVGVWTHVAVVNNAGTLAVYYDGVAQSLSSYAGPSWTNTAIALAIGMRGFNGDTGEPNGFQYFGGKLTDIRITNTAVYTGAFDPYTVTLPPAKITGTKLLINPTDTVPLADLSNSAHTFDTGTVGSSSDYPVAP